MTAYSSSRRQDELSSVAQPGETKEKTMPALFETENSKCLNRTDAPVVRLPGRVLIRFYTGGFAARPGAFCSGVTVKFAAGNFSMVRAAELDSLQALCHD